LKVRVDLLVLGANIHQWKVGIYCQHSTVQDRLRFHSCMNFVSHPPKKGLLHIRNEEPRWWLLAQIRIEIVAAHTHDPRLFRHKFASVAIGVVSTDCEPLAKRILTGESSLGQALIDDSHLRRRGYILRPKPASRNDRDGKRLGE
jgi:hypothetical protein